MRKTCIIALGLSICEVSAHSGQKKRLLALQKRHRFPVGPDRAVAGELVSKFLNVSSFLDIFRCFFPIVRFCYQIFCYQRIFYICNTGRTS